MTGLHVRNQEYIKTAHSIVGKFNPASQKETKTAWQYTSTNKKSGAKTILEFPYTTIKSQLTTRINYPDKINQWGTNTCGPAAYWYSLAYYRPDLYAKTIIELYVEGEAILGTMTLKPDKKTLSSWVSRNADKKYKYKIEAIDWIALASLKNTTSDKYDEPSDAMAAITLPKEVNQWLTNTDWTVHKLDAGTSKRGLSQLKAASKEYQSKRVVHLFVKAKSLGASKSLWWGVDHWVALASGIRVRKSASDSWQEINNLKSDSGKYISDEELKNYQISFKIYSWGRYLDVGINNRHTIKVKDTGDFCKYFYGYISSNAPKPK